jgi:hypothetical protein
VALDGKAQRGRLRHGATTTHPIHAVSAFCHDLGGVLAQLVVDAQQHEAELSVAPHAMGQIDWQGRVLKFWAADMGVDGSRLPEPGKFAPVHGSIVGRGSAGDVESGPGRAGPTDSAVRSELAGARHRDLHGPRRAIALGGRPVKRRSQGLPYSPALSARSK